MSQNPISSKLFLSFVWSFAISIASAIGLMILFIMQQPSPDAGPIYFLLVILIYAAGLVWHISLGLLANRLGRRWWVWVGLSFLTLPIGPLVIFWLMRKDIKAAQAGQFKRRDG